MSHLHLLSDISHLLFQPVKPFPLFFFVTSSDSFTASPTAFPIFPLLLRSLSTSH